MFQWPFRGDNIASPYLWVFFVITIPLTLFVYTAWVLWFRYSQERWKEQHDAGLEKFEKEFKLRLRSATGTW